MFVHDTRVRNERNAAEECGGNTKAHHYRSDSAREVPARQEIVVHRLLAASAQNADGHNSQEVGNDDNDVKSGQHS